MIKTIYKKTSISLVVLGLLFSTNVFAADTVGQGMRRGNGIFDGQNNEQQKTTRLAAMSGNICDRISQRADTFGQKATEQENNFQTKSTERLTNWTTRKTDNAAKLSAERAAWDINRDAQFKALEAKATTDVQKTAVSDFEVTTKAAIATRRAVVDAAIKTFQDGMQTAITTRQGQADSLLSGSKSDRQALFDKAKADRAAGVDGKTVMANLKAGMQASRTKVQTDRQNITKVSAQVATLVAARKAAIDKAFADFKATMEKARTTLKLAFPKDDTTSTAPLAPLTPPTAPQ